MADTVSIGAYLGMARIVMFEYTNHRGITSTRRVLPLRLEYGSTPYHPVPNFILKAYDLSRYADRSFALKDITNVRYDKET